MGVFEDCKFFFKNAELCDKEWLTDSLPVINELCQMKEFVMKGLSP